MGRNPHVLAIPFPAQGHVIPLMELSMCLVKEGFRVTFLNTEFNQKRILKCLSEKENLQDSIHLVSIPDGMESWEDRNDLGKLVNSMQSTMPGKLEELIEKINGSEDEKITYIVADVSMPFAFDVAVKMGIRRAGFWPPSVLLLAMHFGIPKLINDGIIDSDGTPLKKQVIHLSPEMPITTEHLVWACMGDPKTQKSVFEAMFIAINPAKSAEWFICNTSTELEPASVTTFLPNILPIGPLLASNRLGNPSGNFWPEDKTCMEWLDGQLPNSVIYVAFGSFAVFENTQFQELALGLELTNRPFLWVVRPDLIMTDQITKDAYPQGFQVRVGNRGNMVGWAPQQKVLSHSSVACFLSHCGWNSTTEGVSNGVPFLCWPYFADQFLNHMYICDLWKVGLGFDRDDSGIITRDEIKKKVDQLLGDKMFKGRSLVFKEKVINGVKEGGISEKNFSKFVAWVKDEGLQSEQTE